MRGFVDVVRNGSIEGWIVDDEALRQDLCVWVYFNGIKVTESFASLRREDLIVAGVASGPAAFKIPFNVFHHHDLPGFVEVVEEISGFRIPPGMLDFDPGTFEGSKLNLRAIKPHIQHDIERNMSISAIEDDIVIISDILNSAIDRLMSVRAGKRETATDVRKLISQHGLGPTIGAYVDALQDKYPPLEIPLSQNPKVSIIIPVKNHFALTYDCISSISRHPQNTTFEIIIADDASEDETLMSLLVFLGGVQTVRSAHNEGFGPSCNMGFEKAKGEYILFLNNDTLVADDWLDPLVEAFKERDIGVVGSRLLFSDGVLQECGGIVWQDGSCWNWGRGENPNNPIYRYMREVDYVSGAALMISAHLFSSLMGFDALYKPCYFEDTDLCFRVRAMGLKVIVQPASAITHLEGQSNGTDILRAGKRYQGINQVKFLRRWHTTLKGHAHPGELPEAALDRYVKKRVIFLDDTVPTPDQDAGSLAAFEHMMSLIRLGFQVTFIPSDNMADIQPYTSNLERVGVECVYRPYFWSAEDFIRRYQKKVDLVYLHRFSNANRYMELIKRLWPETPIIYNIADLHSLRQSREQALPASVTFQKERDPVHGAREYDLISKADSVIVHSDFELKLIEDKLDSSNPFLVNWAIQRHISPSTFSERSGVGFVGGFRHRPNIDAVEWICAHLMPRLRLRDRNFTLEIIGSNLPAHIHNRIDEGVTKTGFVSDLSARLSSLKVTIAPLRFGAGLKGKVLSSLACGTPCIMSSIAAEGMNLPSALAGYVTDDLAEIEHMIFSLLGDSTVWAEASRAGLDFISDNFSSSHVDAALNAAINGAIQRRCFDLAPLQS